MCVLLNVSLKFWKEHGIKSIYPLSRKQFWWWWIECQILFWLNATGECNFKRKIIWWKIEKSENVEHFIEHKLDFVIQLSISNFVEQSYWITKNLFPSNRCAYFMQWILSYCLIDSFVLRYPMLLEYWMTWIPSLILS